MSIDIDSEIDRLKADYVAATGEPAFNYFFCPILFKDEDVELCAGHIINECLPNSCRTCIVQRKDIDGFYGSLAESGFTTALNAKGKSVDELLENPSMRRNVPWTLQVNEVEVPFYEVRGNASPEHPLVHVQTTNGDFVKLALKVSADTIPDSARLDITFGRSYASEAVASLLKAAHLTMFSVLGYQYVFSAAGQDVARILRAFFLDNRSDARRDQLAAANEYFERYAGMVIPLRGFDDNFVKGSIEDKRFMLCVGSSGLFYALGVFVRANQSMSIVLLAPDRAEPMDTYIAFTKSLWKERFQYHIADYTPVSDFEPAHWKGYQNRFEFDPGERPTDDELTRLFSP